MKRGRKKTKGILLSISLLSFLLLSAGIEDAKAEIAYFTGDFTVQVDYTNDSPTVTGAVVDGVIIEGDGYTPVPVERIQYDVTNTSSDNFITEFTVYFPLNTPVFGATEPTGYYIGTAYVDTGGSGYTTEINNGFDYYQYTGSSWVIRYGTTESEDYIRWLWTGEAPPGLPPGAQVGNVVFSIDFAEGTPLGLQPAIFDGFDIEASGISEGEVLSALCPDTDGDGICDVDDFCPNFPNSPEQAEILFDDFSTNPVISGWSLDGTASWDEGKGYIVLTQAVDAPQVGRIALFDGLTQENWTVSFRYNAGGGTNPIGGADGFVMMFYKEMDYSVSGYSGGSMGFQNGNGGYAIEFDNHWNFQNLQNFGEEEPFYTGTIPGTSEQTGNNHIALISDDVGHHSAPWEDTINVTEDGLWHDVEVTYNSGEVEVKVDGDSILNYTITAPDYSESGFGFSAATGALNNRHIIDDVRINDTDKDSISNSCDNCPAAYNPLQADTDGDFVGDACDNCPFIFNTDQANTDGDEMGNLCDPCPNDAANECNQAAQFDGLTAILQTPFQRLVVNPGDPIPVELCQQNPGETDEYTFFDCFTASYQISYTDPESGEEVFLPTKHKDRTAYIIGIPGGTEPLTPTELDEGALGDVDIIPAGGELCITCYIEERVEFPALALNSSMIYSGDACSTNYLTDSNLVNGNCNADPKDGCFDMKIGTVCASLGQIVVTNRDIVQIDIKPGAFPNTINLGSNGEVPVAILSSAVDDNLIFDPTTIDPQTVFLSGARVAVKGKALNPKTSFKDVNGDGFMDLIVHIETEGIFLTDGDVFAELKAIATVDVDGTPTPMSLRGEDTIRVVPAN